MAQRATGCISRCGGCARELVVSSAMRRLGLFLCSYRKDLLRAQRLAASIERYNQDELPLCVAVPEADLLPFKSALPFPWIEWRAQESVFAASPSAAAGTFATLTGSHRQQVVKAESWRLGLAENLLVLDSDCEFIRPFREAEFLAADGTAFTLLGDLAAVEALAEASGRPQIITDWLRSSDRTRDAIGSTTASRAAPAPAPMLWSRLVWQALEQQVLVPAGKSVLDLICDGCPEMVIYAEAACSLRPIPIHPHGALFRAYLYERELWNEQAAGIGPAQLATRYMGVVWQSNWQSWMDHPECRRPVLSRFGRAARRGADRLRWWLSGATGGRRPREDQCRAG